MKIENISIYFRMSQVESIRRWNLWACFTVPVTNGELQNPLMHLGSLEEPAAVNHSVNEYIIDTYYFTEEKNVGAEERMSLALHRV